FSHFHNSACNEKSGKLTLFTCAVTIVVYTKRFTAVTSAVWFGSNTANTPAIISFPGVLTTNTSHIVSSPCYTIPYLDSWIYWQSIPEPTLLTMTFSTAFTLFNASSTFSSCSGGSSTFTFGPASIVK